MERPTASLLGEVKDLNLSYLVLAQRMLREDRVAGMYRLGFSDEVASVIEKLTMAQIVRLSLSNQLLCRFRFDDRAILGALADKGRPALVSHAHAAIVLAGQDAEGLD